MLLFPFSFNYLEFSNIIFKTNLNFSAHFIYVCYKGKCSYYNPTMFIARKAGTKEYMGGIAYAQPTFMADQKPNPIYE